MNNMNPKLFQLIQKSICNPEGTVTFNYTCKELFDPAISGIVFQVLSGGHIFMIERDADLLLHFYHSAPGTGTRVASIDLKQITKADKLFLCFSWHPEKIEFHVGPKIKGGQLRSAVGVESKKQFRVGSDGQIHQIGDSGIEVMGIRIFESGRPVLKPTAIEAWRETVKAIGILFSGKSEMGFIYENVVTNLSLSILITGFEAYAKERFLEIEQEGIVPDIDAILNSFKTAGIPDLIKSEAQNNNQTVLQYIIQRNTINFQNYEKCKLAYNKAYKIRFGDLDVSAPEREQIKKIFVFRHRIIHVSALLGILNQPEVPPEEPVFSKREFAEKSLTQFDNFITKLHNETLKPRKRSS